MAASRRSQSMARTAAQEEAEHGSVESEAGHGSSGKEALDGIWMKSGGWWESGRALSQLGFWLGQALGRVAGIWWSLD
jgi:hypothetical protein